MKEILLFQRSELYVVFVGFEYTFEYTPERGVVEPPFYGLSGVCYRFEPLIAYRDAFLREGLLLCSKTAETLYMR